MLLWGLMRIWCLSITVTHTHSACSGIVEHVFVHRSRTEAFWDSCCLEADLKCKVRRSFVQESVITEHLFILFILKVTSLSPGLKGNAAFDELKISTNIKACLHRCLFEYNISVCGCHSVVRGAGLQDAVKHRDFVIPLFSLPFMWPQDLQRATPLK